MSQDTHVKALREFYVGDANGEQSRFHVWERGEALGDSVTPSTFCGPYRQWMADLLRKFLDESEDSGLLSVGCGNAAVESILAEEGRRVLGVDAVAEAVAIARGKGVPAVCADLLSWTPTDRWTVLYADGVIGYFYEPDKGVLPVLHRFRSWLPTGSGVVVISIDGPRGAEHTEPHPDAPGFEWLSESFLRRQLEEAGFGEVSCVSFPYQRPQSGPRDRIVLTART